MTDKMIPGLEKAMDLGASKPNDLKRMVFLIITLENKQKYYSTCNLLKVLHFSKV